MTIEAGQQVLHYRLIEKIGEGGMGVVWRAEDTRLRRHVALKFVPEETAQHAEVVDRHLREARAASALNHPNICSVYDVGEWQGRRFIVLELLEGQPLERHIGSQPLEVEAAVELAIEVADALAAAHAKGIIHRDIKPANIFVVEDGSASRRAKMLDFGLAKLAVGSAPGLGDDDATQTALAVTAPGSLMGTVAYMSPEQALGKEVDHRTDIFSLGVVLYEMVTGKRAFEGTTSAAVFDAILNRAPTAPVDLNGQVSTELERILNKALEKDPSLRYQSAAGLRADLERLRRDSDSDRIEVRRAPAQTRRWWPIAVAAAVLVVLAWQLPSLLDRGEPGVSIVEPLHERLTLAVLPFDNIGGDPEQEFFADGMTEEMITVLGRANPGRLGVIARTSALSLKGGSASVREIGETLGVSHVVEGSVRRQGNLVRISAKLIDVADQTQVWTDAFDGTLDDIFALQSRVAEEITDSLAITLLPEPEEERRDQTPDPAAYEEYLIGRFWELKGTEDGWLGAIEHYRKAVELDPGYALAYASLSQAYSSLATWTTVSPVALLEEAGAALDRAIDLAPELGDVHVAKALYHGYGESQWLRADEYFQRALAMDPTNPETAHHWYGHYLSFAGRDREAVDAFAAALEVDPLYALHQACAGLTRIAAGDLEEAERFLQRALELVPGHPVAHSWLGLLRERQGRMSEAVAAWESAARNSGRASVFLAPLGYGYGRLGRVEEAREVLEELEAGGRYDHVAELNLARVHAGLGDVDRAFELLEIAYAKREPWIMAVKIGPGFDPLRDDPRYADLIRRIGG